MMRIVGRCLVMILASCAPLAQAADVAEQVKQIRELAQENRADDAEAAFQEALKEFPDSPELAQLRPLLFSSLMRAGKTAPAAEHAVIHQTRQLQQFQAGKIPVGALQQSVNMASQSLQRAGQPDRALEIVRESLKSVDEQLASQDTAELARAQGELRYSLVPMLFRQGEKDDARRLLERELNDSRAGFEALTDNADRAARYVRALDMEISLLAALGDDQEGEERRRRFRTFVKTQVELHPDNPVLLSTFLANQSLAIREAAQTQPDQADTLIAEHREYLQQLQTREGAQKGILDNALRGLQSLEQMVAAERKRLALIGQPAIPLDVEAWTNGEPLAEGALAGKVVLLDFWAVWCGPCIATFPHLREWHEKYGPQGLEIVGVTRYYEYGWDADAARPKRVPELSPADERQAMVDFATHHKLTHRFAITPKESSFQEAYGVTGIPQAVLIDRRGTVRMIRVGSGDKNAHDLDQMIQQLLAE